MRLTNCKNMENFVVFCGSKFGTNKDYEVDTISLAQLLGKHKKHVIYGGGKAGLMGTVAKYAMQAGAKVTGIIPEFLNNVERKNEDISELIVTKNMHDRKVLLFDKADAAIVLPGGFGTLDELFEMLTWNQLELHQIKVFILNTNGFYNHLNKHIAHLQQEGFLYENKFTEIVFLSNANDIERYL